MSDVLAGFLFTPVHSWMERGPKNAHNLAVGKFHTREYSSGQKVAEHVGASSWSKWSAKSGYNFSEWTGRW